MLTKNIKMISVLLLASLGSVACSGVDQRSAPTPAVRTLPPAPVVVPQQPVQTPQNTFIPPAFEEYKPQALPQYNPPLQSFETYVPEKDYESAYTTPFREEVVVEEREPEPAPVLRRPAPVAAPAPSPTPVEDLSKNELDIDPFADIPEREVLASRPDAAPAKPAPAAAKKSLSAAANALLLAAKAESAVGRHDAAITKIERALRIEPQSPQLWYELANQNYNKKRYDQAISLARKSLQLSTGNRSLVNQNLDLMSKAATKDGNTRVFREVLDYKKNNP